MGLERLLFQVPKDERIYVERVPVDATCPRCSSNEVRRYPVANFIGPRMVTKCQDCLYHLAVDVPTPEDHWPPWEHTTANWTPSRAG